MNSNHEDYAWTPGCTGWLALHTAECAGQETEEGVLRRTDSLALTLKASRTAGQEETNQTGGRVQLSLMSYSHIVFGELLRKSNGYFACLLEELRM